MVDFCISKVRYNEKKEHITYVTVHERRTHERNSTGSTWSVGPAMIVARAFVADLIRLDKASFETIVKRDDGKWWHGAHVRVVDKEYLTTDPNKTKRDNLSNLPEF